jgi:hypothetical protein
MPVRTKRRIAWLLMLAVLALTFGQVAAMPVATVSHDGEVAYQASTSVQTALGEEQSGVLCHHHGNAQGPLCCYAGDCPMLVLALPAGTPAAHPMTRHKLAYQQDGVHPPPGANAAPLLPPPRSLA